jgi:large subunit ribosomal protein L31
MKKGIHPQYYPNAVVHCSCGNTFTVGSTQAEIHTDVCSACHPFFTGEQRIVDTAGQVERFLKRLERRDEMLAEEPGEVAEQPEKPVKASTQKRVRKSARPASAEATEVATEA